MNNINTDKQPRLSVGKSLLLSFALIFFMGFGTFTEVIFYRYMVTIVFVLLLILFVRSKLVTAPLAFPCLFAFLDAENGPALSVLLCVIAIIGFGGFAIRSVHPLISLATPILAYLLAFGITGNPTASLSVLSLVPISLVATLTIRLKFSRTGSIASVSAAFLAWAAIWTFFVLRAQGISLSGELIAKGAMQIGESLISDFLKPLEFSEIGTLVEISEENRAILVNTVVRLLPALFLVSVEIISYFACLIMVSLFGTNFPERPLPEQCRFFRMSGVSAVVFLVSFVLALLPSGKSDAFGIALVSAMNLFVVLIPGLAVCGALHLYVSFRQRRSCFPLVLMVVLLLWFASYMPTVLAFIGAVSILRTERRKDNQNRPL